MNSHANGSTTAIGSASQEHGPGPVTSLWAVADPPGDDGRELVGRLADAAEIALALPALPRPQREAIELAYFGGLSQREIAEHRRGEVPLSVPVTLLRHHAAGRGARYLAVQTYLDPFPARLGLRSHA